MANTSLGTLINPSLFSSLFNNNTLDLKMSWINQRQPSKSMISRTDDRDFVKVENVTDVSVSQTDGNNNFIALGDKKLSVKNMHSRI